jgi:hypothetical protein
MSKRTKSELLRKLKNSKFCRDKYIQEIREKTAQILSKNEITETKAKVLAMEQVI